MKVVKQVDGDFSGFAEFAGEHASHGVQLYALKQEDQRTRLAQQTMFALLAGTIVLEPGERPTPKLIAVLACDYAGALLGELVDRGWLRDLPPPRWPDDPPPPNRSAFDFGPG